MSKTIQMPALSPTMEEGTLAKWLVKEGDKVSSGDLLAEIETDKATMEFEAVDEGVIASIMVPAGTEGVKVGTVIAMIAEEGEDVAATAKGAQDSAAKVDGAPVTVEAPASSTGKPVQMPALSPTMEEGTLAKWLVKEGDKVSSGDLLAEIETDKATMDFEAVDEGVIASIMVPAGTEGVKVGTVIAMIAEEGAAVAKVAAPKAEAAPAPAPAAAPSPSPAKTEAGRVNASPLARRMAQAQGVDLSSVSGSGPNGRVVKTDLEGVPAAAPAAPAPAASARAPAAPVAAPADAHDFGIPHEVVKLSGMRKTIARRLTESKQQVPHIYLTVDVRLDRLLKVREEMNSALSGRGVKLSVNDLLIKALGVALMEVPACNVQFAGDRMLQFKRADISVAVSIPGGLITPIVAGADGKGVAAISAEMKDLAARAKDGKLKPEEYLGGTASLSNMGMFGIKQFEAVINPPQGMIMAIGAGDKRPFVIDDTLQIATVMSATGSFDHRAIDGADGARLMKVFRELVENPLGMLA